MAKCNVLWVFVNCVFLWNIQNVMGQEDGICYGPGSIATSVVLTFLVAIIIGVIGYFLWKKFWKARKEQHLILETDPEKGKGEYAFDNPGFKDAGLTPVGKVLEKSSLESGKSKWNQWSPLGILTTKSEKKRTQDDSMLDDQVKVVSLRSHDFIGLGFNICGNMKDGIYIKDVLHHGPALESGKLHTGDRILSVTISFEHMVYEDALTILSYASPYEVIVSAKNGKIINFPGQSGRPGHPIYRSSSSMDLSVDKTSKRRLFQPDESSDIGSNYSSLQKTRSNATTLERNRSKSPKINQKPIKPKIKLSPDQLKTQLEQNIVQDYKETIRMKNDLQEQPAKIQVEIQKTENKFPKFGIQVFPTEQKSPKSAELSQNDNNINLEKTEVVAGMVPYNSIDEVDKKVAPPVKKREKINKVVEEPAKSEFERDSVLNHSGVKRDENNIPLEIPNNMYNAAVSARKNRKSMEEEDIKSPKKKGKAPSPPEGANKVEEKFDEIYPAEETEKLVITSKILNKSDDSIEKMQPDLPTKTDLKGYNSDSDIETDNQSSVNTIELNASDITIHQSEENEEKQNRKTASTGDLSKIQKTRKTSTGTLERAQSLDITDTTMPTLAKKRKAGKIEDNFDSKTSSDDSLYGNALINKEPRLSLILDGLNTFQRSRLKKSTEWGNLEDAILNVDKADGSEESLKSNSEEFKISAENITTKNFNFGAKSPEFDALLTKISEIKQENIEKQKEDVEEYKQEVPKIVESFEEIPNIEEKIEMEVSPRKSKNQIWPVEMENDEEEEMKKPAEKFEIIFNDDLVQDKPLENKLNEVKLLNQETEPEEMKFNSLTLKDDVQIPEEELNLNLRQEISIPPSTVNIQTEHKPLITHKIPKNEPQVNLAHLNDFIIAEREASSKFLPAKLDDTNVSDDIKVSRHTMGNLDQSKFNNDVNVSNITISDTARTPSFEVNVMKSEVKSYQPEKKEERKNYENVIVSTPDLIKNITIAEAIHDLNNEVTIEGPTSLTFEIPSGNIEVMESTTKPIEEKLEFKSHNGIQMKTNGDINKLEVQGEAEKNNSSLTYITEIQVLTPNINKGKNISEIEIIPKSDSLEQSKNLDNDFETYIKNFESNIKNFENNINSFEQNIQEIKQSTKKEPSNSKSSIIINEKVDAEKELLKVQEIVEEQLKKLPEMRFTTSSYESQIKPPEKRHSQIEILRSNFEKSTSPPRMTRSEISPPKSRIPVLNKTPPTSPERRDSKNLENEPDKEILEIMSSHIPMTSSMKYQPKTTNRNITVTSIRSNSKIPSGLPTYSSRPPVPPRKTENHDDHLVQISTNGNTESSFRQWVFNPNDSITNITVTENKYENK